MRSTSGGPLTACLLFAALFLVPLLAVFGVPQFAPVVASPGNELDIRFEPDSSFGTAVIADESPRQFPNAFPALSSGNSQPHMLAAAESPQTPPFDSVGGGDNWNDPFADAPASPTASPTETTAVAMANTSPNSSGSAEGSRVLADWARQNPVQRNADEHRAPTPSPQVNSPSRTPANSSRNLAWAMDGSREVAAEADRFPQPRTQSPRPDVFGEFAGRPANDREALPARQVSQGAFPDSVEVTRTGQEIADRGEDRTWRSAVRRLNELGIQHFTLEPGTEDGFYFSCFFTPADNPRITHRFEAEAGEPLRAVEKVIEQVEQWLAAR